MAHVSCFPMGLTSGNRIWSYHAWSSAVSLNWDDKTYVQLRILPCPSKQAMREVSSDLAGRFAFLHEHADPASHVLRTDLKSRLRHEIDLVSFGAMLPSV